MLESISDGSFRLPSPPKIETDDCNAERGSATFDSPFRKPKISIIIKQYQGTNPVRGKGFFNVSNPRRPLRSEMTGKTHRIAVLPGDGSGPEVVEATLTVLNAIQKVDDVKLEMLKGEAGFDVISKYGTNQIGRA